MKITKPIGVNKDGYASGGVEIEIPSQNLIKDPRAKSSIRDLIKESLLVILLKLKAQELSEKKNVQ